MKNLYPLAFFLLFLSCTSSQQERLDLAFFLAGTNKAELEKVLAYYEKDSLKRKAACFLIENMIGKGTIAYQFYKKGHQFCELDTYYFANEAELEKEVRAGLFLKKPEMPDLKIITARYLIDNIELAFKVRERYPWCKRLSFDRFCREILPYRVKNEEPGNWRQFYYSRYRDLADSLAATGGDLETVVYALNQIVGKRYLPAAAFIPGDFSYTLIEHLGGGTCDHLALNAVQLMRALGIPLYLDLLPYHGKINGGHAYNSFLTESNKLLFFSPYEREPERNKWLAPLILRVDYEINEKNSLLSHNPYNRLLTSLTLRNVTAQYFKVTDVSLHSLSVSDQMVYLTTYNRAQFKAVAEAEVKDGTVTFQDLTCGLLYFPMLLKDDFFMPVSSPFIIREDGVVVPLQTRSISTSLDMVPVYDVNKVIDPGHLLYQLFYWENRWKLLAETSSAGSGYLNFGPVPYRSLFLVKGNTPVGSMQRPFLIENGRYCFY